MLLPMTNDKISVCIYLNIYKCIDVCTYIYSFNSSIDNKKAKKNYAFKFSFSAFVSATPANRKVYAPGRAI